MANGEILFIIVPSEENFKKVTVNSLLRHEKQFGFLETYGFYFFEEKNKHEWCVYDNVYLNILNICVKFKDHYDYAVVMVGNIFFNITNFLQFDSLLKKINFSIFRDSKFLLAGYSYTNSLNLKFHYNESCSTEFNKISTLFKKDLNQIIDLNFCFINFHFLKTNQNPIDYIKDVKINLKNEQFIINYLLMNHNSHIIRHKNFLKINIHTNDLGNEKLTNFINTDNELFIYRFTDSYFPLKNLNKESNINLYNYYIFNRFYEEFELMDESEFSDEFYYYVKNTYLKTSFTDILKLIK